MNQADSQATRQPGVDDQLEAIATDPEDYGFTFSPYPRRIRVEWRGAVLAESDRVMVLEETRLPPVHYFPSDDVRWEHLVASDHVTWCPFKGNASYWHAEVAGERARDVAWSYLEPLDEARHIAAYVAFYRDRVDGWYEDGERRSGEPHESVPGHANVLVDWLVREAATIATPRELTAAFARKLLEAGVPLWRLAVIIRTLHPQVAAVAQRWWAKRTDVEEVSLPYSRMTSPQFLQSPLVPIYEGAGGIRRRLDIDHPRLDFPILEDLHREGATDYVAMPMTFLDGQINVVTLCSDRPGGFSTHDLGHIYEILPMLGRLYELHTVRRSAVTLLDTYLGAHAGERVLRGLIKRGDGERIRAVIWFCDLRDSTRLAQSLAQDAFLSALNEFFDCMAGAVLAHGGQVLRFIGDAALAIFPLGEEREVVAQALDAAVDAGRRMAALNERRVAEDLPPFRFGLALHLGEVTYGNIGTENRLEFTVIGDAANRAARIESLCKVLDEPLLVSAEIARRFPERTVSLGRHELSGVSEPIEIFALREPG
ncbi:MAG: DUF427 domain-containing protein [Gammaproteobacteria bacterium]|nr:DUF427 domain-containing protein [Gammaproteobacteria bacterium]